MSDSLRDQIEAAYKSSTSESNTETEVEEKEEAITSVDDLTEEAKTTESSHQDDREVDDVPAPEHWAAEDKEVFKSLDKKGKEFLIRRHKDMEAGYTKKQQSLAEAAKIAETYKNMMGPHEEYLKKINMSPEVAFDKLMSAQRVLMTGTDEEKALIMHNIAQQYKVDLSREVDPVQQYNQIMWQRLQELEQRQNQIAKARDEEVAASYQSQITSFAQTKDDQGNLKHPHFESVKKDMGLLLQAGKVNTLEEAYELSILMDAGLRKEYLARQSRLEDNSKKAVASKKAGFNVKSGSGGQISDTKRELSTRELLSQAYDAQMQSRR